MTYIFEQDSSKIIQIEDTKSDKHGFEQDDPIVDQEKVENLNSLRQNVVDWSIKEHRWAFIDQLHLLIRNWKGQYPNLREIFQPEEIDRLLTEALEFVEGSAPSRKNKGAEIIRFVARSGYRDEAKVDQNGNLVLNRTTPVHRAIKQGRYIIQRLFDIYNVNYIDVESGLSHFHVACRRGCENIVAAFLELGQVDPNLLAEKTRDSPLQLAAAGGCVGVMRMLLTRGADPNLANAEGSTPMHAICRQGDCDGQAEILIELCRKEYRPVRLDARNESGDAALHDALARGRRRMAEFLLRNGADPNLANGAGETGLHIVCRRNSGSCDLASMLFEVCRDVGRTLEVNAEDSKGWTPLNWALFYGKRKTVELLLKEGADPYRTDSEGMTSLHVIASAVAHDFLADEFFQIMAESHRPLQVNAPDKKSRTPLHLALANNNRKAAEALLRRHANPDFADDDGYTALHVICKRDKDDGLLKEFFKMIDDVRKTVNVDARNKEGNTPLHLAAAGGKLKLVELLLERQADPNSQNKDGSTPLHLICKRNVDGGLAMQFFKVADAMKKQVRIDAQDNSGQSPLHLALAARCCNRYLVKELLRNQADPNLPNEEGQTPLHLIGKRDLKDNTAYEFFRMCQSQEEPLEVDAVDDRGQTPLRLAVANLLPQEVDLLLAHGADLSAFAFPTGSDFREALGYREDDDSFAKGDRVGRALLVLKSLEHRGYEMDRSDALTIMKLFDEWGFFQMVTDPEKVRCKETNPKNSDYYSSDESIRKAAHMQSFEIITKDFFRRWAAHSLEELLGYELSIESLHDQCEKKFGQKHQLLTHQRTVSEGRKDLKVFKDYLYDDCGKKFGNESRWILHIKSVHENRKYYACNKCETKFGHKTHLLVHQRTVHEGQKDFACDKCDKKFGQPSTLTRHQKTVHEGRKDFVCEKCEKKFGLKFTLISHQRRVHEGQKDFLCDKCEKKFGHKSHLLTHLKIIHEGRKDFACDKYISKFIFICCGTYWNTYLTMHTAWDLNYIDEFGLTHFHVACKLGYVDVVRKFLDLGQDPNLLVRGTNDSPLILALVRYNMEVVKLLLRRGADQNLPNKNGLTPLHLTCQTDEDAASYWPQHFIRINDELNQLVQVNAQDKFGNTPLHFAVHHGKREKVEFLLRRGANVNLVNAEGSTALHIACHRGYDDATMELLFKINKQLDRPVRVNVADNWGRTPLQLAVAKISPSNLDILVNNGADVSSFVFPTDSYFGKGLKPSGNGIWFNFKLRLASGALLVVERLERAGYELDRSDALAIMKLFAEHGLFEKAADLEKHWYYDYPHFETQAREMTIAPGLSLHDLVSLSPEEAKKRIAREDYFKLARSVEVRFIPSTGWNNGPESRDAFLVHLPQRFDRPITIRSSDFYLFSSRLGCQSKYDTSLRLSSPSRLSRTLLAAADNVSAQETLIYDLIAKAGDKGIWNRELKEKTKAPDQRLTKITKSLASKKLIKIISSVKDNTRKKLFMLYNLKPSTSITGGVCYVKNWQRKKLVEQFVEHFFTAYDSSDRTVLKGLYHENAWCSTTVGTPNSLSNMPLDPQTIITNCIIARFERSAMSDLINFESPSPSTSGGSGSSDGCEQQQRRRCHNQPGHLASPLIPAPTLVLAAAPNDDDDTHSSSDLILRRSLGENNPFDVVSRKANDYERNRDDPFERVMSAAAEGESFGCAGGGSSGGHHLYDDSSNSSSLPKRPKLVAAAAASSRRRDSLVPELENSNHDDDDVEDDDATNSVPVITLSSSSEAAEMSILSISAMNDSLTDSNETNLPLAEQRLRVKSRPEVQPTVGLVPKLRKKSNSEIVSKKGPLKAVIPLGSMHKGDFETSQTDIDSEKSLRNHGCALMRIGKTARCLATSLSRRENPIRSCKKSGNARINSSQSPMNRRFQEYPTEESFWHPSIRFDDKIDGASLLVLSKKAIIEKLGGLHGKLGPALKIYKQLTSCRARAYLTSRSAHLLYHRDTTTYTAPIDLYMYAGTTKRAIKCTTFTSTSTKSVCSTCLLRARCDLAPKLCIHNTLRRRLRKFRGSVVVVVVGMYIREARVEQLGARITSRRLRYIAACITSKRACRARPRLYQISTMPSHMAMRRDPAQKLHKVKKRKDQQHPVSDGPEIPGVPYGRKLLRSIDLLRRRKARPDQNRLIGFMLRTHKIDGPDTMKTIRKLIELEEVIEVNYKGSISYRNASNWSRLPLYKNRPEGFRKDKINSTTVSQAFSELVLEEPDYLNTGIPAPSTVRRSKAERKQKLQVRSDDSQDMFDLLTDNNDDHKEEFISSGTPSPTSDINNTNSFRAARRQVVSI
ncbi:unnamed protein product [Trichogramma brassicae]|uniref:Uncharacterized protein n=1 Tax=Trichogramma brassicae TaxID=86971 RepID=A0A6H5I1Y6_9HYME|nr:unnamed protein product [Trichogramma brassicae]